MIRKIKKILNNDYSLSVIVKLITAVIGVISSSFSTRFLGIQYKGDYGYISQVANIVVLILNLGIYQSFSYNYKRYGKEIINKYVNICYFQFCLLLLVAGGILLVVKDSLLTMIVILVPFNILKLQYGNIILIDKIKLHFGVAVLNSVITTICYIALYYFATPSIFYVVLVLILGDVVAVLCYTIGLKIVPKIWKTDFNFMGSVLRFGFIPMLSGLLATINYHIDVIFLKHIGIPEELSYYSLAAGLITYVWMIPDAFKSVLFSKSGKKFDKENIQFSSQFCSIYIFLCFIGFAVLGKFIIEFLYGAEFVNSYGVVLLLIIGAFSMSFFKLLGIVLVSQGRRIAHFTTLAISAVINVILNFILIPVMGMYGAAIASVCSYTVCGVFLLVYFCRLYKMPILQLILPTKDTVRTVISKIKKDK